MASVSRQEFEELARDVAVLEELLKQTARDVGKLNTAMPRNAAGELMVVEHRMQHEASMRAARAQEAFWNELRTDIAKKGLWGAFIVILGLVAAGLGFKNLNFL